MCHDSGKDESIKFFIEEQQKNKETPTVTLAASSVLAGLARATPGPLSFHMRDFLAE